LSENRGVETKAQGSKEKENQKSKKRSEEQNKIEIRSPLTKEKNEKVTKIDDVGVASLERAVAVAREYMTPIIAGQLKGSYPEAGPFPRFLIPWKPSLMDYLANLTSFTFLDPKTKNAKEEYHILSHLSRFSHFHKYSF